MAELTGPDMLDAPFSWTQGASEISKFFKYGFLFCYMAQMQVPFQR